MKKREQNNVQLWITEIVEYRLNSYEMEGIGFKL